MSDTESMKIFPENAAVSDVERQLIVGLESRLTAVELTWRYDASGAEVRRRYEFAGKSRPAGEDAA